MTEVKQSVRLKGRAAEVWNLVGAFNGMPDWHPMVEKSELAEGGTVRRLTVPGGILVERLEGADEKQQTYQYAVAEGPLPVADYHSTLTVREEGDETVVEWEGRFEPRGVSAEEAMKAVQGIYQTGLDNLKRLFGG